MKEQPLLQPYDMNGLQLKNRIVMAPMTRSRSDNPHGAATELTAQYYEQRAGAGLIITEGTYVSAAAAGYINVPGIYTDTQVAGWRLGSAEQDEGRVEVVERPQEHDQIGRAHV